ncbi:hypothetical protein ASF11_17325 [Acidovorax sp. Leaf76]|uniref:hypothetical protein n=1 Tax=unclassified Acidovorax TaxID=2684926 RepID=UPI0006F8B007|nr:MULTISPECIES: hypothetical protein [unclassified Acidovorax]KQO12295.1 hypothetical protein ASF11_17325 [Acidovorax sp. Leaf76]KQO29138.1 hypothetical protein ASF19_15570 [Acidovorax sp. Leaf84]KQS25660.1 hypothetical protein ASG27_17940 [Acidovorax sp. Leaf191]
MFAIPLIAPLHETLTSHVFGRFMSRSAAPAAGAEAAVSPLAMSDAAVDDAVPDLAQRVRETGEW